MSVIGSMKFTRVVPKLHKRIYCISFIENRILKKIGRNIALTVTSSRLCKHVIQRVGWYIVGVKIKIKRNSIRHIFPHDMVGLIREMVLVGE